MAPKVDQAAIIILDIGKNVSITDEKDKKSFFDQARECVVRIIERKIMSQGNNFVGIILLGTKSTKNNMSEQCDGAFRHIELQTQLQAPSWKMIRDLPKEPSKSKGDWMDSLMVAADHFKNGVNGVKISNKKIILMTNFSYPTSYDDSDIEQVINGFKEENFELDVIGLDLFDDLSKGVDIAIARKFVEATDGANASFEDAMRYLLFHKKKSASPFCWNVDLSIGPHIKIPVSSYIKLKDEPAVKKWVKAVKDPISMASSTSEAVVTKKVHINTEKQELVDSDALIKGYHYGQQIIPFSNCDMSLLYKSGDKSLSVYGFTHSSNNTWQTLNGEGLCYVFGRKGDRKAQFALRCLVQCLDEMNLVAIARRVYNNGNTPKMYALMPVIDNNDHICLSMAELCYKDEIKFMTFPPTNLKKYEPTDEQVDAFKDLIKAMDLTKAYDDDFEDAEAFPIAETVSPSVQYILDCIAYRAMNPDKPLPPPREEIMMLFKVPPLIKKRSQEPLEKLKKLLPLNKIQKKTKVKKNAYIAPDDAGTQVQDIRHDEAVDIPKIQLPITEKSSKIGTSDPVNDFKLLIESGKSILDVSKQMIDAIENLVQYNLDGTYTKALAAMKAFRAQCVKSDPSLYNDWLKSFKTSPNIQNKKEIFKLMSENQLLFISKEENSLSVYDSKESEEKELCDNDNGFNATELTMDTEINDLFDEI